MCIFTGFTYIQLVTGLRSAKKTTKYHMIPDLRWIWKNIYGDPIILDLIVSIMKKSCCEWREIYKRILVFRLYGI